MLQSQKNTILTLSYMMTEPENKYFDRKSAQIKPSDLAPLVAGFANAEGGAIVVGISDKTLRVEGINAVGEVRSMLFSTWRRIIASLCHRCRKNF